MDFLKITSDEFILATPFLVWKIYNMDHYALIQQKIVINFLNLLALINYTFYDIKNVVIN